MANYIKFELPHGKEPFLLEVRGSVRQTILDYYVAFDIESYLESKCYHRMNERLENNGKSDIPSLYKLEENVDYIFRKLEELYVENCVGAMAAREDKEACRKNLLRMREDEQTARRCDLCYQLNHTDEMVLAWNLADEWPPFVEEPEDLTNYKKEFL